MTNSAPISSWVPAERAERDSDTSRGFHVERSLYNAQEMADAQLDVAAADLLCSAEWWADYMEGLASCEAIATCLARCYTELDRACRGQQVARDAVFTALHNLERDAKASAREDL